MNELNQNNNAFQQGAEAEEGIKIKDVIALCLKNWGWIALSVVLCLGAGVFYLMKTPPVYTRSASLLIKQDRKGRTTIGGEASAFADMGLFVSNSNVYNELTAIQSPDIISVVASRLHLDMNYSVKHGVRTTTLYGRNLPIEVEMLDITSNDNCSFLFTEEKDGSIYMEEWSHNAEKLPFTVKAQYCDTVDTPVGRIRVIRSPYYNALAGKEGEEGSGKPKTIRVSRRGIGATTNACAHKLSVSLNDKQATIIDLSYKDQSKERGDDFLKTLIAVYNESWVKDKNQVAVATSQFINERLAVIEQELGSVDSDISTYKSQNLIPDVQAASNMYMSQANAASAQILELSNKLYMARYIKTFSQNGANEFQLLPANSGIDAPVIEKQIAEYNSNLLRRNSLVANSSAQNPLVVDLDEALAMMREAILFSIDNQINSLNAQISGYRTSEQKSTSRIASNPTQAKYLLSVERQQKVKESLYLFLLQKREENELSQAFTAYNTRVIKQPTGPAAPTSPSSSKILLLALIIGFGLPIGIIVISQMLDTRVRGRKDLEKLSIPYVGEIPQIGKSTPARKLLGTGSDKKEKPVDMLVKPKTRDVVNEAFRVVRSNLEYLTGMNTDNKVMMITSFDPHSGKTFITLNLGESFSIKGLRVLIIDMDLRKVSLSKVAGKPEKGISSVLSGKLSDWRDAVVKIGEAGLEMLPSGPVPPNPAELLYSPRLAQILNEARAEYDIIMLDCPPIDLVADTAIIAGHADITTFVVRAGLLEREMLPHIENLYSTGRYKNMAMLLNCSKAGGKYGYRYGYQYGYGSYGTKEA